MEAPKEWVPAKVITVQDETPDVRSFLIAPEDGTRAYSPGAHIEVSVLVDGQTRIRNYSLLPQSSKIDAYRIAVKLHPESRGGSAYMWTLGPGAKLSISVPLNSFELAYTAPEYLLVAGGIGITPLLGMAANLVRRGSRFRFLYAARSEPNFAFAAELKDIAGDGLSFFDASNNRFIDIPGEIENLHADGELYLCGPMGLLDAARKVWRDAGRPMDRFRFETFGDSGSFAPEAFDVHIPRLGKTISVPPSHTLLDALVAAGVDVLYDCKRGECGLCALDVLEIEGTIDHRDVFFSEAQKAESRKVCACVSRAVGGSIVIDTDLRG